MLVESFHNRLETFYMNRRPNRRLDDLVMLLLEIENDDYLRRRKSSTYKESHLSNAHASMSRHERSMNISEEDVAAIFDDALVESRLDKWKTFLWKVKSNSKCDDNVSLSCSTLYCI